jgi:hypothetical protein
MEALKGFSSTLCAIECDDTSKDADIVPWRVVIKVVKCADDALDVIMEQDGR